MGSGDEWTCERCGERFAGEVEVCGEGFCLGCYGFVCNAHGREYAGPLLPSSLLRILVCGNTTAVRAAGGDPHVGKLLVPGSGNAVARAVPYTWAADNGAFAGFDEPAFVREIDEHPLTISRRVWDRLSRGAATGTVFPGSFPHKIGDRINVSPPVPEGLKTVAASAAVLRAKVLSVEVFGKTGLRVLLGPDK